MYASLRLSKIGPRPLLGHRLDVDQHFIERIDVTPARDLVLPVIFLTVTGITFELVP
jgi:hypothetical protein